MGMRVFYAIYVNGYIGQQIVMLQTTVARKYSFSSVCETTLKAANFDVVVSVSGPVCPVKGMVIDIQSLDQALKGATARFSGRSYQMPVTQLAQVIFEELRSSLPQSGLSVRQLRLFQGEDFGVEIENHHDA
jgi:hypothetical protein